MLHNLQQRNDGTVRLSSPHPFTLVQHNCLGRWDVFLFLFGSFSQLACSPLVVALQDPPVYRAKLPTHSDYRNFFPPTGSSKPRVAFFLLDFLLSTVSVLPWFFDTGDIMALDFFTPDGFFLSGLSKWTIVNSYSTKGLANNTRTVPPDLVFPSLLFPTLILGDLNLHHPTSDPLRDFKEYELAVSCPYFDKPTDLKFSLFNTPGVYTRFSMSTVGRPGVLDLVYACPRLIPSFSEWSDPPPSPGSDHIPILLSFNASLLHPPALLPNWALTDWTPLGESLKNMVVPPPPPLPTSTSLGSGFDINLNRITGLLVLHMPTKRITFRSKPWWLTSLSELRTAYHVAHRVSKRNRWDVSLLASVRAARSSYFKAIKKAKREHWVSFLSSVTPQTVWTAKKFAFGRPPLRFPALPRARTPRELNEALLQHFFPESPTRSSPCILLPFKDAPVLEMSEVMRALA